MTLLRWQTLADQLRDIKVIQQSIGAGDLFVNL
jgi:hypothetical protein